MLSCAPGCLYEFPCVVGCFIVYLFSFRHISAIVLFLSPTGLFLFRGFCPLGGLLSFLLARAFRLQVGLIGHDCSCVHACLWLLSFTLMSCLFSLEGLACDQMLNSEIAARLALGEDECVRFQNQFHLYWNAFAQLMIKDPYNPTPSQFLNYKHSPVFPYWPFVEKTILFDLYTKITIIFDFARCLD